MVFLQGQWHVAYRGLFPHSFAHTLTDEQTCPKKPNFITISSDQTSTSLHHKPLLLQLLLEIAGVFVAGADINNRFELVLINPLVNPVETHFILVSFSEFLLGKKKFIRYRKENWLIKCSWEYSIPSHNWEQAGELGHQCSSQQLSGLPWQPSTGTTGHPTDKGSSLLGWADRVWWPQCILNCTVVTRKVVLHAWYTQLRIYWDELKF